MIKKNRLASLVIVCAVGAACMSAIAESPRAAQTAAQPAAAKSNAHAKAIEPYRTQLFNLLTNEKNIVDRKNYYQGDFAKQFDGLLASSSLAKADKSGVSLKKRLLSGPAPDPALLADPATGTQWISYDACQAHRCDETWLRLLFDPASRKMVGKLNLNKQSEYLGAPSAAEKRLLEQAR